MSGSSDIYRLRCPGCDEEVDVAMESVGQLARCPYCSTDFFASEEMANLHVVDDTPVDANPPDPELEFNKHRIQSLAALRMAAVHGLSWCIVSFWICIVVAVQLLGRAVIDSVLDHRWGVWRTMEVILAIGVLILSGKPRREAAVFKNELARSALTEPTTPPDFSTLSDGSERWKELENIH